MMGAINIERGMAAGHGCEPRWKNLFYYFDSSYNDTYFQSWYKQI